MAALWPRASGFLFRHVGWGEARLSFGGEKAVELRPQPARYTPQAVSTAIAVVYHNHSRPAS
jgi:hypothetical protein